MRRDCLYALSAFAALALGLTLSARADGPSGIGFAQAEEGTWWCEAVAARDALDCARQKCMTRVRAARSAMRRAGASPPDGRR